MMFYAVAFIVIIVAFFIQWKREFDEKTKLLYKGYYEKERSEMAAIDKIYGTKEQYDEFWLWCEINLPEAHKYFYEWYDEWNDGMEHPMTNFPERIDKMLFKNCPLEYVRKKLKVQYPRWFKFEF